MTRPRFGFSVINNCGALLRVSDALKGVPQEEAEEVLATHLVVWVYSHVATSPRDGRPIITDLEATEDRVARIVSRVFRNIAKESDDSAGVGLQ
jgi:hypothetical protein